MKPLARRNRDRYPRKGIVMNEFLLLAVIMIYVAIHY
jgi:hypothetical protein